MFWIILKLVHVKLGQPACCSVINECLGLHCIWFARILCYITSCTQNFLLCYFSLRLVFVYVLRKSSCCRTLYAHSSHACTNLPKLCSIDKLLCVCVCVCACMCRLMFSTYTWSTCLVPDSFPCADYLYLFLY
uniref:Secreted protein n=1 Tax=Rhipicephalus microplus TaxID=6941 RepID=A0A6G5A435_RHIMP